MRPEQGEAESRGDDGANSRTVQREDQQTRPGGSALNRLVHIFVCRCGRTLGCQKKAGDVKIDQSTRRTVKPVRNSRWERAQLLVYESDGSVLVQRHNRRCIERE